jgi:hypothetical protein
MTENQPTPVNKAELLSRIKISYERLSGMVADLDAEMLNKSLGEGTWAIKDILAHIASWEDVLLRFHIQAQPFDQVIGLEGADYWESSEDEINEHFYREHRNWTGERVLSYLQTTHENLIKALEALPEDGLGKPTTHPGLEPRTLSPLVDYVVGNTTDHYQEHYATIQEIIALPNE